MSDQPLNRRQAGNGVIPPLAPVLIAVLLVLMAAALVVGPAAHLGVTADEGAHIAAGLQWWIAHRYSYEPLTPPLARIAVSFLPWLWGFQSQGQADVWSEGRTILLLAGNPGLLLFLARCGTLLFLAWGAAAVWLLAQRIGSRAQAAVAVGCFVTLPPILGNAEVAATDLAQAATFGTLIYAGIRYLDAPSRISAALFGVMAAFALLAKFTTMPLFLACVLVLLSWRWFVREEQAPFLPRLPTLLGHGALAVAALLLVILAVYRFRTGSLLFHDKVTGLVAGDTTVAHGSLYHLASLDIYPAFEFWRGLLDAFARNTGSAPEWFWGAQRDRPSPWFFPVALVLKTPLPFLALLPLGIWISLRRSIRCGDWAIAAPWLASVAVLACSILEFQHLGIRYLLSVYVFLAVTVSAAIVWLWTAPALRWAGRAIVVAAGVWTAASLAGSRQDYLGWFNSLAQPDPAYYEDNNDVDWGQNGVFLAEALQQRHVQDFQLMLAWYPHMDDLHWGIYHDVEDLARVGVPHFTPLPPDVRSTGWIAINKESLRMPQYRWLNDYRPETIVGNTIAIYHIDR